MLYRVDGLKQGNHLGSILGLCLFTDGFRHETITTISTFTQMLENKLMCHLRDLSINGGLLLLGYRTKLPVYTYTSPYPWVIPTIRGHYRWMTLKYKQQTLIVSLNFAKIINVFFESDWLITMLFQGQQRCWSRNMSHLVKSGSACGSHILACHE